MTGISRPTYRSGFYSPIRGGVPKYPGLWRKCVGAWAPILGATGAVLKDQSVNKNHGTLTNMEIDTDWVNASGGMSLHLIYGDYIESLAPVTIDSSNWTMEMWVKATTIGATQRWLAWGSDGPVFWSSGGAFQIVLGGSTIFNMSLSIVSEVPAHICVTRCGSTITAYKDGVQTAQSTSFTTTFTTAGNVRISRAYIYDEYVFDTKVDTITLWNRALAPSEVTLLASRRGVMYELRRNSFTVPGGTNYSLDVNSLQCNAQNSTAAVTAEFGLTSNSAQSSAQNSNAALTVEFATTTNSGQCIAENSDASVAAEFGLAANSSQCSAENSTAELTVGFGLVSESAQCAAQNSSDSMTVCFETGPKATECAAENSTAAVSIEFGLTANNGQCSAENSEAALAVEFSLTANSGQASPQNSTAALEVAFAIASDSAQCSAENSQLTVGSGIDLEVNSLESGAQNSTATLSVGFGLASNSLQCSGENSTAAATVSFGLSCNSAQCNAQNSSDAVSVCLGLVVNNLQVQSQASLCNVTLAGRRRRSRLFLQGGLFKSQLFLNG